MKSLKITILLIAQKKAISFNEKKKFYCKGFIFKKI